MPRSKDYLREIQKFTTSQYWGTGVRITAGVMVPTFILAHYGWLSSGMPFLWGALFVSLTDTPGPIHHRRNGMLAAIGFNTISVLIISLCRDYHMLLLFQVIVFTFFLSLLGIYGNRAGAVGTLALVIMLLNLVPRHEHQNVLKDCGLIAAGGAWYTLFSLLLYRLRPYRLAEQAIGENLIDIADYIRAKGAFYKPGADLEACFNRLMQEQITVQKNQDQTRDLLFKTRQFVADASPKSRSVMMIFLDSMDLFEQTMFSYQHYELLHKNLDGSDLLNKFYGTILQLAAELEHIGLSVQADAPVKKDVDMTAMIDALENSIRHHSTRAKNPDEHNSLNALKSTLANIQNIANRMQRIVLYTRLEFDHNKADPIALEASKQAAGQPLKWQLMAENFTLKSNNFRYSIRLTLAMLAGFSLSAFFSLTHTYWVLLTIITILRPIYTVTRERNIQRVGGTFSGAFLAIIVLSFITNNTILLVIMVLSMLIAYSLLRVDYFSFVLFLTLFIIITFHFLNPVEFKILITERLLDTVIGSIIAALAARFILPVWEHEQIEKSIMEMLAANRTYFIKAWSAFRNKSREANDYKLARKEVIVALTNLSDNFQKMLAEPQQNGKSTQIHQFVIANHMLTGHIAALSSETFSKERFTGVDTDALAHAVEQELLCAENHVKDVTAGECIAVKDPVVLTNQTLNQLSIIYSLSRDIRLITQKI